MSGDIAGLGGATKPVDEGRNVNAVFGELNIPVIKNLDLNLATRYDGYNDVGSTTNWKGNLRWQPMQQLLLRGSYGTGFRAPIAEQSVRTPDFPDLHNHYGRRQLQSNGPGGLSQRTGQ